MHDAARTLGTGDVEKPVTVSELAIFQSFE